VSIIPNPIIISKIDQTQNTNNNMRFQTAVTILASSSTLPLLVHSERHAVTKQPQSQSIRASLRSRTFSFDPIDESATTEIRLQNKNTEAEDPDVGILSCGTGLYCAESDASSLLGGYCESNNDGDSTIHHHHSSSSSSSSSSIEDQDLCAQFSSYYDCDCSGFDGDTQVGTISCMVHEHHCFEGDDFCARVTKTFTTSELERPGTLFAGQICYDFDLLLGEESSYCMHYTYPDDDCRIVIDGLDMGSCDAVVPDCDMSFDCLSRLVVQSHNGGGTLFLVDSSEDNTNIDSTASNQEFTTAPPRLRTSAAAR
jgi:hypothetical protein